MSKTNKTENDVIRPQDIVDRSNCKPEYQRRWSTPLSCKSAIALAKIAIETKTLRGNDDIVEYDFVDRIDKIVNSIARLSIEFELLAKSISRKDEKIEKMSSADIDRMIQRNKLEAERLQKLAQLKSQKTA